MKETHREKKRVQLSASRIKIAAMCPRAFLLSKHYKRRPFQYEGAGIGKFVHSCLSLALENLSNYADQLQAYAQATQMESLQRLVHEIVYQSYFTKLPHLMRRSRQAHFLEYSWNTLQKFITFLTQFIADAARREGPLAVNKLFLDQEWSFKVTLTNEHGRRVNLTGRIDVVAFNPFNQKFLLWDFKTYDTQNLDIDILQLATYYLGVKTKLGVKPWLSLLYCTEHTIRAEEFTAEQMELFQPQFRDFIFTMLTWITGESLPPRAVNPDYCEICTVSQECHRHYPVRDDSPLIKAYF